MKKAVGHSAYSTPSILDALRDEPKSEYVKKVDDENNQYVKKTIVRSLTEPELAEAWKTFVSTIEAPQLKSALSAREPKLNGQAQIEYELDTELQYNRVIQDLKPKLSGFLRRQFDNESIEVVFSVSEHLSQQSNIPYTDDERWNLLVSRYPALGTLKSKFGLDFEHY